MSMGGIFRWKDGRNMPDVHAVLFQYGNIPVYMRLNLGLKRKESYRFMGSKGTSIWQASVITFSPQTGENSEPSYYAESFPKSMRDDYFKKWHQEHDPVPGKEPEFWGNHPIAGAPIDDVRPHLWNFFQAVRTRQAVIEDAVFGHHAALACHMANESYFRGTPVYWDEAPNDQELSML